MAPSNTQIQDNVNIGNWTVSDVSDFDALVLDYTDISGGYLLTFDNCTFTGTTFACHITSDGSAAIQNITFNNCTFQDINEGSANKNYSYGLLIDNKLNSSGAQGEVSGITVTNCTFNNIGSSTGATGATNGGGGIGSLGISIHELKKSSSGSADITIKDNTFTNIYSGMSSMISGVLSTGLLNPAVAIQLAREPYNASVGGTSSEVSTVSPWNNMTKRKSLIKDY